MARDEQAGKSSDMIDKSLKQIFQQEVDQELPDRFTNLIERLRAQDLSKDTSTDEGSA